LSSVNFPEVVGEWRENQILISDWTYFHCPNATLVVDHLLFFCALRSSPTPASPPTPHGSH